MGDVDWCNHTKEDIAMKFKLDFSPEVKDLEGIAVIIGADQRVLQTLDAVTVDWSDDQKADAFKKMHEIIGKPLTIASACIGALLGAYDDEKSLGDQERIRRYELARTINKGGEVEFNTTERDLIKKLVGKRYQGSLVAPVVWEMLEGADKVSEPAKDDAAKA